MQKPIERGEIKTEKKKKKHSTTLTCPAKKKVSV